VTRELPDDHRGENWDDNGAAINRDMFEESLRDPSIATFREEQKEECDIRRVTT